MKFGFGKRKSSESQPVVGTQKPSPQDIHDLINRRRIRRIQIFSGILIILAVAVLGFYFLFYKPYQEGMNLVKRSEEQTASKDYDGAMKSLGRARLVAPFLKSLNYREGIVKLLEMKYSDAESSFNEEIISGGYVAGSELALGFICAIDAVLSDSAIPPGSKKEIINELSKVLEIDITLNANDQTLNLAEKRGSDAALEHFSKSMQVDNSFTELANFGLAYAYALKSDKDTGLKSYAMVSSSKDKFPTLAKFYEGIEPKLGAGTGTQIADSGGTPEGENPDENSNMPEIPVGDLPPIPDNINIPQLPDIGMPSSTKLPGSQKPGIFKQKPTVKPFKLSQYQGKTGEMKYIVTLLNISDRGQTVAREGQHREMPFTHVDVFVVKLSDGEIILKEDNMYSYKWIREGNSWVESEEKGENPSN